MRELSLSPWTTPPPGTQQFTDLQHFAAKYEDATLAITIATQFAVNSASTHEVDNFFGALSWLQRAKDFNPKHLFFTHPENIQTFLANFSSHTLRAMSFLFVDDKTDWLLEALRNHPRCNQIVIYDLHCLNERFSKFLASSTHLKQITLAFEQPLHNISLSMFLVGLERNTSLESLMLRGQLKGDADVECLLNILSHPHCKIHTLDLSNCNISEACANMLLDFVINSKKIKQICLEGNPISTMTLNNIQRALLFTQYRPLYAPQYRALKTSDKNNLSKNPADEEVARILKVNMSN
jgi:hypothetical protein